MSPLYVFSILSIAATVLSKDSFCDHVRCDFQHGSLCHYANSREIGPEITKPWIIRQVRMRSSDPSSQRSCNTFAAAYLDGKDTALMETVKRLVSPARIRFKYYEATDGAQLLVCCGDPRPEKCPFKSNLGAAPEDQNWQSGVAECPAGTEKIVFVAINTSGKDAVVSLDDIECA